VPDLGLGDIGQDIVFRGEGLDGDGFGRTGQWCLLFWLVNVACDTCRL
jgi:hypothetical protein